MIYATFQQEQQRENKFCERQQEKLFHETRNKENLKFYRINMSTYDADMLKFNKLFLQLNNAQILKEVLTPET